MPTEPQRPAGAGDPEATMVDTSASPPQVDDPAATLSGTETDRSEAPGAMGKFDTDASPARDGRGPAQTLAAGPGGASPEQADESYAFATEIAPPSVVEIPSDLAATQRMAATGVFTSSADERPCPEATVPETLAQTQPLCGAPISDTVGLADTQAMEATGVLDKTVPPVRDGKSPPQGLSVVGEQRCGRYVLKRFHARGGMGEVWMAEDPDIGRAVAIKRTLSRRPPEIHRFRVEAQVTGQLEHPGIVPVHELGTTKDGQPFYAMKFVEGRTLKKVVEEFHAQKLTGGAREVEQLRLLQMFLSVCQTVAYAHSRGVLHRDLKPENVMLGSYGETILLDWGIAKVKGQPDGPAADAAHAHVILRDASPDTATQAGSIMGTPAYMAPEVASGSVGEVDERSDIYLLGATLFEMLTGRQPRTAKTAFEMVKKAKEEPPPPARTVNPLVPKALEAICTKAMSYRKEDRYPTALALADDIQQFIAGEPVSAYREPFAQRAWRWTKRHRTALTRAAAAVFLVGVGALAIVKIRDAERRRLDAVRVAARLEKQEKARRDVKEFRRLADEASYSIATNDPASQHAPYHDPRQGETVAAQALALASSWGPSLEGLPLEEERGPLKSELAELLLLTAHLKDQLGGGPGAAREVLERLDRARALREPSVSEAALRSRALTALEPGKPERAAPQAKGVVTAFDHFLRGETLRRQSGNPLGDDASERKVWEPDRKALEGAVTEYRRAIGLDPDHYWSWFQLGRCSLALGRLTEAVDALGTCIALRPQSPWGYSARGLVLEEQGRVVEAEADLDRALQLAPEVPQARLNRGLVFWKQKKYEKALTDFDALLQGPPEKQLLEAAYYRGRLYLERNEPKKALDDLNRVVGANPGYLGVYLDRPLIFLANNQPEAAIADLDTYLRAFRPLDPQGWEIHGLRGRLLRRLYSGLPLDRRRGDTGKRMLSLSLSELVTAVKLGGHAAGLFDDLGAMFEHAGRPREAIAAYSKGLDEAPNEVKLRNKRGWAFEQLGLHERALADFAAAAKVEPEDAEAHTGAGYVRAVLKRPTEAQRDADLALLHGGDRYLILHNVACIYATLSKGSDHQGAEHQEAAIALLRRALKLWKQAATGPSELDLMKAEPAFEPLRGRDDFRELIRSGTGAAVASLR